MPDNSSPSALAKEGSPNAASGSQRTDAEREISKVEKKLREITKLIEKREAGEALERLQEDKLTKEPELRRRLAELHALRTAELEASEAVALNVEDASCKETAETAEAPVEAPLEKRTDEVVCALAAPPQRVKFDATIFLGDWLDTLGHRIIVTPGTVWRGSGGHHITYTYCASVYTAAGRLRRLVIAWDDEEKEWRCGNGVLIRADSNSQVVSWRSLVGRITRWTRTPPLGPVYFDMPQGGSAYFGVDAWAHYGWEGGWEGTELNPPWSGAEKTDAVPALVTFKSSTTANSPPGLENDAESSSGATPDRGKVAQHLRFAPAALPSIYVEGADNGAPEGIQICNNRLDWIVPGEWEILTNFPRDANLSSPSFCVHGSTGMRLEFFPNGTKSSELGYSTVQLVRGPENKSGIKFELVLNGRSSGPKACLGRRFLTDYPKPVSNVSNSQEPQRVIVSMLVLGVFG